MPGDYRLVETPPAGYTNTSTSDLTGLYKTTLAVNSIDVTISDGSATQKPWLLSTLTTNQVGMYFSQGPNSHGSYVGQFSEVTVNEQDVPYSTSFATFCVDLVRSISAPPNHTDTNLPCDVMPLKDALAATAGTSAANAGQIAYLYNHYGLSTSLTPTDAAGLQLAIWQLEYGSVSVSSLVSPPAGVTLQGVIDSENNYLSLASGKNESAYYLNGLTSTEYPSGAQGLIATESFNFIDTKAARGSTWSS